MILHSHLRYASLLFLTIATASATSGELSKAQRFERLCSRYDRSGFINGSVLIAEHGKVIYSKGFGFADMNTHTANTPQTKFDIASITKQFTAALVLQQVSEERIRLSAKVSDYLPWYRSDTGNQITIEQLLHHTSGLPADYDAPAFNATAVGATRFEPQAFAQNFCQSDLTAAPGTKWQYSNCGYIMLGLILERATGSQYGDLLRDKLLLPVGMFDTGLDQNGLQLRNRAFGYERHFGPTYVPGPHLDLTHIYSAGAMYSTTEDLFRWSEAMSSETLFPRQIRDQVFAPGIGNWGYGWFITKIPQGVHGSGATQEEMRGDLPGNFFCSISRFPETDAVIIVLRNGYGSTERLEANLQAVLFDGSPRVPWRKPADLFVRALHAFAERPHHGILIFVFIIGLAFVIRIGFAARRSIIASNPSWR